MRSAGEQKSRCSGAKKLSPTLARAVANCVGFNGETTAMKKRYHSLKPYLSVTLLISTLFSMMFLKMEVRRMGYSVLKTSQEYHKLRDHHRMMSMEYARLTRPEHIRKYAMSRLTLNDARNGQIIQLTGQKFALPQ